MSKLYWILPPDSTSLDVEQSTSESIERERRGHLMRTISRIERERRGHLTRTVYSDRQGDPPARTWGQDVEQWGEESFAPFTTTEEI